MRRWWTAGAVGLLLVGGSVLGQLSQSGGSSSVVSARQSGPWTVTAGVISSGSLAGMVGCDHSAALSLPFAATRQAVAAAPGKSIHVCGFVLSAGGRTSARLVQGAAAHCGSGPSQLTPEFHLLRGGSVSFGSGLGGVLQTVPGNALCVTNASSEPLSALLTYTVF